MSDSARPEPVRTCVGCRQRAPQSALTRVSAEVTGEEPAGPRRLVAGRRNPGRGAWLHPERECLQQAVRRRSIPRALRLTVAALDLDLDQLVSLVPPQDSGQPAAG